MSVTINALGRGGFSTYGQSSYDQRAQAVIVQAEAGEVVDITATFPSAISSVTKTLYGLDATDATISGSSFTSRLSGIQAGGWLYYDVTLSSGEVRRLRVKVALSPCKTGFEYGDAILAESDEALILE